jgi:hypothetical protein
MTQNEKGPAASGIACQAGSTISSEETKMNSTEDSTGPAAAPVPILRRLSYQRKRWAGWR